MVEGATLEMLCRGNSTVGSNPTLSAIFLPPSESLNQSQFAQPPLKPVDTKGFTNHIVVCLKHTQTAKSERFLPIFGPSQSEF